MTELTKSATDAAVEAFFETLAHIAEVVPGAYGRRGANGTRVVALGLPIPTVNSVWVDHQSPIAEVEEFAKELSTTGLPWSIQVRGEVDPALKELAAGFGMTSSMPLPLLVWDAELLPSLPSGVPQGTTVRKVPGTETDLYASALVAGYGMPREVADSLSAPALLDDPDLAGFVLDLNGEAVATGFNMMTGDYVAMYNGSVPPEHRGKGYYRALVAARLRYAVESGARYAVSQNTPMSRPLYESFGFQLAETWTCLLPAG
jgi:GNAT superfamily N-acetyltransferase